MPMVCGWGRCAIVEEYVAISSASYNSDHITVLGPHLSFFEAGRKSSRCFEPSRFPFLDKN
jgi:hypothetical protein